MLLMCVLAPTTSGCQRPAAPEASARHQAFAYSNANVARLALKPNSRFVREGIAVEFTMTPIIAGAPSENHPREGDDVVFRFSISDTATGSGLAGVYPAAWMAASTPNEPRDDKATTRKIASFIRGSRSSRPELDLNVYYVLALNADATITVVDPLFGFGNTKLLSLIPLPSPGLDWALSSDQSRLYVSAPDANQVVVIDTTTWRVAGNLAGTHQPGRVALQPDGHYVWATQGDSAEVLAFEANRFELMKTIPMAARPNEMAFSEDSAVVCVIARDSNSASLIDIRSLAKVAELTTGVRPVSVAYSAAARMFYVANENDGTIAVLDPLRLRVVARIEAEPGLGMIRFAPGGRLGLVVNPRKDVVHVIDAAGNLIAQTADTKSGPDQVSFTSQFAYIRHRNSETVRMIPLEGLGQIGKPVRVVDFPGGQNSMGAMSIPSLADSIVPASGDSAVLVANPADRAIYYYKEGMAAPKGNFSNYKREPRAVLTVDRSLRETSRGVYETTARLPRAGRYDVLFLLNDPRMTHRFEVEIREGANHKTDAVSHALDVTLLPFDPIPVPGHETRIEFRLEKRSDKECKTGLTDLDVLCFLPGNWQYRQRASEREPGVYAIEFTPPQAGTYYLYLTSQSLGLTGTKTRAVTLEVTEPKRGRS
jgi:DNA-binding beta-propeller fold protein YncE